MTTFTLLVPCAIGVEKYLANELKKLDLEIVDKEPGRFRVQTDLAGVYRVLRSSRMAERVMLEFTRFKATTFDQFYQGVRDAFWHELFPADAKIHMEKVRLRRTELTSASSLQSMAQKAIYDTLMRAHKVKAATETGAETMIRIYGEDDYFRLAVDLSGEALHKRGWRKQAGKAPLKETIAAAMVQSNVWRRKTPLHDPFCGSGTICIEALCYAANLAPNLYRTMAIEHLSIHQASLDKQIQGQLRSEASFENLVRIKGSDSDARMIDIAKKNVQEFCQVFQLKDHEKDWVNASLGFETCSMEAASAWAEDGLIICNPPYGERMLSPESAKALHDAMLGLKTRFPGWALSVITTETGLPELLKEKPAFARPIHNGASEVVLYRFEA